MSNDATPSLIRGETKSKWRIGANVVTHKRQRDCIRELLSIADERESITKVLDCPAGAGRMVDLLLSWQVTCADITKSRLEDIKRYFPGNTIETRECDIFDLPFGDNEFDLVLNALLIQHIEKSRLRPMLRELRRVTRRWLVATYPSSFSLVNIYRLFRKQKMTTLTRNEFNSLVSDSGFRVVESRYVLPFLANGKVVLLEKIK